MSELNTMLIAAVCGLSGIAGGWFIGYHAGLKRASEAIWEGMIAETSAMDSIPPWSGREKVIKECIEAVLAVRGVSMHVSAPMVAGDWDRASGMTAGVDKALDALRALRTVKAEAG